MKLSVMQVGLGLVADYYFLNNLCHNFVTHLAPSVNSLAVILGAAFPLPTWGEPRTELMPPSMHEE